MNIFNKRVALAGVLGLVLLVVSGLLAYGVRAHDRLHQCRGDW